MKRRKKPQETNSRNNDKIIMINIITEPADTKKKMKRTLCQYI
jgi:hypothetical protein